MTDQTNQNAGVKVPAGYSLVQDRPPLPEYDPSRAIPTHPIGVDDAAGVVESLIRQGVDPARVKAAANASGFDIPPPDTRSATERAFDNTFPPPASASDFRISYVNRVPADFDTAQLRELDMQARTFLNAAGFPAEIGASVIEMALDAGERARKLSAPERQAWDFQQEQLLARIAKSPEAAANARKIADKVLDFGPKELTDRLRASGSLSDAAVIMQLAMQGERMAARARLRS